MQPSSNLCYRWPIICFALINGCSAHPPASTHPISTNLYSGLSAPVANIQLQAMVTPPRGWIPDPIKLTDKHRHQVWLSPTGSTAYGVIYFDLPLPMGDGLTLTGFIRQMKNSEGEATLISQTDDDSLPGIRFVAEGGLYKIRCNLTTHGFHGWVVYAGTLRSRPVNSAELQIAELARERTKIGLP